MQKLRTFFTHHYVANKYTITLFAFILWMLFFDQRNIFVVRDYKRQLQNVREKKAYYQTEINKAKQEINILHNDSDAIEKLAREHYGMKKMNEDVYIITPAIK